MKIVDKRTGEVSKIVREVQIYPNLAQNDNPTHHGYIAAVAKRDFNVIEGNAWSVSIKVNMSGGEYQDMGSIGGGFSRFDNLITAMQYARKCAKLPLLFDASLPLPPRCWLASMQRRKTGARCRIRKRKTAFGKR